MTRIAADPDPFRPEIRGLREDHSGDHLLRSGAPLVELPAPGPARRSA